MRQVIGANRPVLGSFSCEFLKLFRYRFRLMIVFEICAFQEKAFGDDVAYRWPVPLSFVIAYRYRNSVSNLSRIYVSHYSTSA